MVLATLLLQVSLLAHPLYLEEQRPEIRSAQHILLWHSGMHGLPGPVERSQEEALELMQGLVQQIEAGASLSELATRYSSARTARYGGCLGTFPKGMLRPEFDEFLFSAKLGDLSPVIVDERGIHLLQRIETHVAVMQIQLKGTDNAARTLAASLIEKLDGGADFGELAAEHSVDLVSKSNRGMYRVFERGERNLMIKGAAFDAPMNKTIGPIESPLGLHILRRVDSSDFPRELWDDNFIRASGILVSHLKAVGVPPGLNRTQTEAREQVDEVIRRVEAGEDFAAIAARFNDDPGGKERRGYLGWVYRYNPDLPAFFGRLFLAEPGAMTESVLTPSGVVVLRRE